MSIIDTDDGEVELIEVLFSMACGAVAFIAAQFFVNKYKDALFDRVHKLLPNHPNVRRVMLSALKANHCSCEAIKLVINKTVYVLTQFVGVNASKQTEALTTPVPLSTDTSVRNLSDEELLKLGYIPEKVAKGMGLIDKAGNIKAMHEICNESKVLELRNAG